MSILKDRIIDIGYTGADAEDDLCSLTVEYSKTGVFGGEELAATQITSDDDHDGDTDLAFTSGGTTLNFVWDVSADLGTDFIGKVHVRLTANDGNTDGTPFVKIETFDFTAASDEDGAFRNVSGQEVSLLIKDPKASRYYSVRLEPGQAASPPQYVLDDAGFLAKVKASDLKIIRHGSKDNRIITNRELDARCSAGFVTLGNSQTETTVAAPGVINGDTVILMPANAAAAATGILDSTYVNPDLIESGVGFTISHPSAAGMEEFQWMCVTQKFTS